MADSVVSLDVIQEDMRIHLTSEGQPVVHARIVELVDNRLIVETEMSDEQFVSSPRVDTPFHAVACGDKCTYHFDTAFVASSPLPSHLWYMAVPDVVVRRQIRHHVRVPIALSMRVNYESAYGTFQAPKETTLVDISGNGVCFISTVAVEKDSRIVIEVDELPVVGKLRAIARVKRCAEFVFLTDTVYHVGAILEEHLERGQQDKLIKSLFQLQRGYLQRGLGI